MCTRTLLPAATSFAGRERSEPVVAQRRKRKSVNIDIAIDFDTITIRRRVSEYLYAGIRSAGTTMSFRMLLCQRSNVGNRRRDSNVLWRLKFVLNRLKERSLATRMWQTQ